MPGTKELGLESESRQSPAKRKAGTAPDTAGCGRHRRGGDWDLRGRPTGKREPGAVVQDIHRRLAPDGGLAGGLRRAHGGHCFQIGIGRLGDMRGVIV